jgi:hypothetical protein
MSYDENAVDNHNTNVADKSLRMGKFKCLRMTMTNYNCMYEDIKTKLYSGLLVTVHCVRNFHVPLCSAETEILLHKELSFCLLYCSHMMHGLLH